MGKLRKYLLFFMAFFFLSALSKTIFEYQNSYSFYEEYKKDYEYEKKRNIELKTLLVKTKDSYEFEKNVRNRLNLHKENEVILVIPEPTSKMISPTPTPVPQYQQWIDVFFKN
jgi:hypothetical protein